MKLSLAQKLVVIIEVVVVIFGLATLSATYFVLHNSLLERTGAQLQSVGVLKESMVKKYLHAARDEMQYFVASERRHTILLQALQEQQATDRASVVELFGELIEDGDAFRDVMLLDPSGEVISSSNPLDIGKIKDPASMTGEFYYDVTIGETAMALSTPILDDQGVSVGWLAGRLGIVEISKLMVERSGLGQTGETYIVNSASIVVTDLLKESGAALKKAIYLPQITDCTNKQTFFGQRIDYHNDLVLGYYQWMPEVGACLITEIDQSEAFAPIASAALVLLSIIVMIGVVVGVFGLVMGKRMMKPLSQLRDEANKIQEGNFETQCEIDTSDEIGEVATAFNEMVTKLKEVYLGLEDKVKEKTGELTSKLTEMEALNATLSENKSAMLNLLEDSKNLEEQLKVEKAGVEKKVEERTEQLSDEQAKLMASIATLPRAIVLIDKAGKIVVQNGRLEDIFGEQKTTWDIELLSAVLKDTFDLPGNLAKCLEKSEIIRLRDASFGSKYLNFYLAPVLTHENELIGAVLTIKDNTEARVMARSKDEFFSIASHELRTPLTAIRGNTSMMLEYYAEAFKDPELKQMLDDTHDASVRLIGIVNDFLDMSRLEMGKIEFKMTKVDLIPLIEQTLKEYQVTGSRQKLHLELVPPTEAIPLVSADTDRLRQVLINLVGNGIKFTKEGGIRIELHNEADKVAIWVIDTGTGIPLANQGLLFHKFQQAGSSLATRDTSKGTGLGLYISRLLIEGMGGKLDLVKSEEGKGSVFGITLPIGGKNE